MRSAGAGSGQQRARAAALPRRWRPRAAHPPTGGDRSWSPHQANCDRGTCPVRSTPPALPTWSGCVSPMWPGLLFFESELDRAAPRGSGALGQHHGQGTVGLYPSPECRIDRVENTDEVSEPCPRSSRMGGSWCATRLRSSCRRVTGASKQLTVPARQVWERRPDRGPQRGGVAESEQEPPEPERQLGDDLARVAGARQRAAAGARQRQRTRGRAARARRPGRRTTCPGRPSRP